jgi:oligoendopeptidase F
MAECLEFHEALSARLAKLNGYAFLQSQVQWSNTEFQNMASEANRLQVDLAAKTARLEADVLRLSQKRLETSVDNRERY